MEIQGRFEHMNVSSPCYLPDDAPIYRPSGTDPPAPIIPKSYEEKLLGFASAAVDYYNSNHQCCFELVNPLYMECIHTWAYPGPSYYHLSFIARSKDSSRKLKLFFAEVTGGIVNACTHVEPGNPLFPCGCGTCHPLGVIYHPLGKYKVGSIRSYKSPRAGTLITREESAKKLLCETYIFKDIVQELYAEEDEELKLIVKGYAVDALNWHALTKEGVYELLEPVACVRFGDDSVPSTMLDSKTWAHVTFTARNTDPLWIDASPELFFAELNLDFGWVVRCVKMTRDGSGSLKSEAETSCAVCREVCPMFHPVGKYNAGLCGGTFADAQVKERSWGAKVELLEKVSTSSNAAGEFKLKNSMEVYCHRGIKTLMSTSWTGFNPSRGFWTCSNSLYPCGFFLWFNPPLCQMAIEIISGLIRSTRENKAVKSKGGNQTRLGTTWKFLWVCLVIAWMILAWVIFIGNVDEKCSCESRKLPAINGQ